MRKHRHNRLLAGLGSALLAVQATQASTTPVITHGPLSIWDGVIQDQHTVLIGADLEFLKKNPDYLVKGTQDVYVWKLSEPILLPDGSTIDEFTVGFKGDPFINLNFAVTAGAADTTFGILSASLPVGFTGKAVNTSASVTLTDNIGNGATLTGLFGGKTYEARYNAATVYADLTAGFAIAGGGGINSENAVDTALGFVTTMQSEWKFKVSGLDSASGTSHYEIVRAPDGGATWLLLAMGSLLLVTVRRERPLQVRD